MDEGQFNPKDIPENDAKGFCGEAKILGESAGLRPCPHCGYCPTCGRPQNVPYYPPYPYNPGPWYWTVTSGDSTHFDTRTPNV